MIKLADIGHGTAQEALDTGREDLLRDAIARDNSRKRRAARVHTRGALPQARAHVQTISCRWRPDATGTPHWRLLAFWLPKLQLLARFEGCSIHTEACRMPLHPKSSLQYRTTGCFNERPPSCLLRACRCAALPSTTQAEAAQR